MIGIAAYRCRIGQFNLTVRCKHLLMDILNYFYILPCFVVLNFIIPQILRQCNDVEQNPGPKSKRESNFNFCHLNIRSILAKDDESSVTKFDELCALASTESYDLIGVTETWLDDSISNNELIVPGYLPAIRRDRARTGGGVLVFVSEHLPAKRRQDLEPINHEIICMEIQFQQAPVLVCVCYRPPHADVVEFLASVERIKDLAPDVPNVIVTGDFNGKHTSWCPSDRTCINGRLLKAFFDSHNFDQLVTKPTQSINQYNIFIQDRPARQMYIVQCLFSEGSSPAQSH